MKAYTVNEALTQKIDKHTTYGLKKRILFISDSLGMPRLEPELVCINDTWPYRVSKILTETCIKHQFLFYYHTVYGLTTDNIVERLTTFNRAYDSDMIVMQVGIVDCYPRALKKIEQSILKRIPIFCNLSHALVKKHYQWLVQFRKITYVDKVRFAENCQKIFLAFKDKSLFILPIAPPSQTYQLKNNQIEKNITEYNVILKSVFGDFFVDGLYVDITQSELFLSDGYHLSTLGNRLVASRIASQCIRSLCND